MRIYDEFKGLAKVYQFLVVAVVMALVLTLFSCASVEKNPVTSQLVVSLVTGQVIEQSDDPHLIARRIVDIGEDTLLVLQPDTRTSLDIVVALVQAKIDYELLTPVDRDAVDFLLIAIQAELAERVAVGELQNDEILIVRDVVQWVVDSASRYLP